MCAFTDGLVDWKAPEPLSCLMTLGCILNATAKQNEPGFEDFL